jgi:hypothetical protein
MRQHHRRELAEQKAVARQVANKIIAKPKEEGVTYAS